MSAQPLIQSERVRMSAARRKHSMKSVERRAELTLGVGFVIATLAIILIWGVDQHFSLSLAVLYVLGMAAASHVRFDIGAGFTVPTQVVFVPMLFALPLTLVPVLVAVALGLGMTPAILTGRLSVSRLFAVPGNSWFALGPCVVLLLAQDHYPDRNLSILLLALLAQFICDFVANIARERMRNGITISELAEEMRQIYLIDLALSPLGLAVAFATSPTRHQWSVLLIAPLFGVLAAFSRERRTRLEQLVELNDAYRGTALVLGDVVEADDSYTGEHCKGVVRLALELSDQLGLDAQRRRNVEFSALLHDVGKIAVPKEIINKPGKLDEREWAIIKTHTIEGQKMLERVGGFMREVGQIIRSSHERWDGKGYPDGLVGSAIPLEARIVSVCDAFNAMTTTRSYRPAMPLRAAVVELQEHSGTQFDPQVIAAILTLFRHSKDIASEADQTALTHPEPMKTADRSFSVSPRSSRLRAL